jgi:hypothetical protein
MIKTWWLVTEARRMAKSSPEDLSRLAVRKSIAG